MYRRSLIVLNLLSLLSSTLALSIEGQFETKDFFLFLNKFGFQQTSKNIDAKASFGYIFGNITSSDDFPGFMTLAVLDRHHFLEFYGNRWEIGDCGQRGLLL